MNRISQHFYASTAGKYDLNLVWNGYRKTVRELMTTLPKDLKPQRILDAGAGTGLYTVELLNRFPGSHITAVDMSTEMLDILRKNIALFQVGRVDIIEQDVLLYAQNSKGVFDMVVTGGVLEYLSLEAGIRACAESLKSGGMWIHAPVRDTICGRLVGLIAGFKPHPRDVALALIKKEGFVLTQELRIPKFRPISFFKEIWILKKI